MVVDLLAWRLYGPRKLATIPADDVRLSTRLRNFLIRVMMMMIIIIFTNLLMFCYLHFIFQYTPTGSKKWIYIKTSLSFVIRVFYKLINLLLHINIAFYLYNRFKHYYYLWFMIPVGFFLTQYILVTQYATIPADDVRLSTRFRNFLIRVMMMMIIIIFTNLLMFCYLHFIFQYTPTGLKKWIYIKTSLSFVIRVFYKLINLLLHINIAFYLYNRFKHYYCLWFMIPVGFF